MDGTEHTINGRKVDPKKAIARTGKIFVGGIKPELSDDDVRTFFAQFGKVVDLEVPFDKQRNTRKGFCFVTFEQEQVVNELLKNPQQTINGYSVDLRKATPKPEMGGMMGGVPMGMRGGMRGGRGGGSGGRGRGGQGWGGGWGGSYGGYGYGYGSYDGKLILTIFYFFTVSRIGSEFFTATLHALQYLILKHFHLFMIQQNYLYSCLRYHMSIVWHDACKIPK